MNYSICYISKESENISRKDIEAIFDITTSNNNKNNIKGILLHGLGHFFQVIEGEEKQVKLLFEEKIMNDNRHKNISTIFERKVDTLLFEGYESKFNIVKTLGDLQTIKKYLIHKTGNAPDKILRMLKPFILYQVH